MSLEYKPDYERHLPHIQPPGATLFVTFRLAGSLPVQVVEQLKEELSRCRTGLQTRPTEYYRELRRYFGKFDTALDKAATGPTWLKKPAVAQIVVNTLHVLDTKLYTLDTYCVMSNHVHIIFTPLPDENDQYIALQRIMHSLKRHTALEANRILGRKGQFWQDESYDHVVRDEGELNRIRQYVLNNPIKAGIVANREEWPWLYSKTGL